MRNRTRLFLQGLAILVLSSRPINAAELGIRHFGLRGGLSANPDQFHGGLSFEAGSFKKWLLRPSFDLGFGNGVRLGAANFDALYPFSGKKWRPYAGGGLGLNFIDVTNGVGEGRGLDIEPVLNVVGGLEWAGTGRQSRATRRYIVEARVGLGETPDFKLTMGVVFE